MAGEINLTVMSLILFFNFITSLNGQYNFVKRGSPIPSAPIIEENNPYLYTFHSAKGINFDKNIPQNEFNFETRSFENEALRNDRNQQRVQLSPPASLGNSIPVEFPFKPIILGTGPTPGSGIDGSILTQNEQPVKVEETYTPAPEYGPPPGLPSQKGESILDYYVFVPAFPSSPLTPEGDPAGAAPPPPLANNGFVPPDGALLAPPAPFVNGNPLPSPRNLNYRRNLLSNHYY